MKKLVFSLVISLFLALLLTHAVDAQTTSKGVSVTPSIAHIDLAVDPPEYELTYVNNFDTDITITLSAKDFTELEDSYKLEFLDAPKAQNYKYSLSSWISFETKTLELAPHEKKSVKIYIDKNRITKGGHYASILAEIAQPASSQNIGIKAVLSSLLFVRASTGKEVEDGKIFSFEPLRDNYDYPDSFLLRFQNSGNVHVIPYGTVIVYDPFGNLVAKGIVNENSLDALPESIRSYTITSTTYQKVLIPGTYTAKLSIHFGKTNQKLSQSIKFFSMGGMDFIKTLGLIVLLAALVVLYRKKFKRYPAKS